MAEKNFTPRQCPPLPPGLSSDLCRALRDLYADAGIESRPWLLRPVFQRKRAASSRSQGADFHGNCHSSATSSTRASTRSASPATPKTQASARAALLPPCFKRNVGCPQKQHCRGVDIDDRSPCLGQEDSHHKVITPQRTPREAGRNFPSISPEAFSAEVSDSGKNDQEQIPSVDSGGFVIAAPTNASQNCNFLQTPNDASEQDKRSSQNCNVPGCGSVDGYIGLEIDEDIQSEDVRALQTQLVSTGRCVSDNSRSVRASRGDTGSRNLSSSSCGALPPRFAKPSRGAQPSQETEIDVPLSSRASRTVDLVGCPYKAPSDLRRTARPALRPTSVGRKQLSASNASGTQTPRRLASSADGRNISRVASSPVSSARSSFSVAEGSCDSFQAGSVAVSAEVAEPAKDVEPWRKAKQRKLKEWLASKEEEAAARRKQAAAEALRMRGDELLRKEMEEQRKMILDCEREARLAVEARRRRERRARMRWISQQPELLTLTGAEHLPRGEASHLKMVAAYSSVGVQR